MSGSNEKKSLNQNDFWEVNHAASRLTSYACSVSARHIQDATLRLRFNREVAYYMRGIVRDVESGKGNAERALSEIRLEKRTLGERSAIIGQQIFGAYAGAMQIYGGISATRAGPGGFLYGGLMIAHGGNNIYENVRNLKEGRSDVEGPIRKAYQDIATYFGTTKSTGSMAYGYADIGLSGYGLFRLIKKKNAWRIFRYVRTDFRRGFEEASKGAIATDIVSTSYTLKGIHDESKKERPAE